MNVFRRMFTQQWPLLTVVSIFIIAFCLVGANFWRKGALLISIATGIGAVLRLTLPENRAGWLVLRTKTFDCAIMAMMALVMFYIAATIDPLGTR